MYYTCIDRRRDGRTLIFAQRLRSQNVFENKSFTKKTLRVITEQPRDVIFFFSYTNIIR